jgi:hypothetical protein
MVDSTFIHEISLDIQPPAALLLTFITSFLEKDKNKKASLVKDSLVKKGDVGSKAFSIAPSSPCSV